MLVAPIDVTLTPEDVERARIVGEQRTEESKSKGFHRLTEWGFKDPVFIDLIGAAGELAFCKATGMKWTASVNTFKLADASFNIQIRTAPCRAPKPPSGFGRLRVYNHDNEQHFYVLVVGNIPHFRVVGYARGIHARRPQWFKNEGICEPAWFVPGDVLRRDIWRILP